MLSLIYRTTYPEMGKALYEITDRLQIQMMDRPLTIMSMLSELRGKGYNVTLQDAEGEIQTPS